jgi:cell fate (sporulation/competence/biofilm development) regulator YlbF (YheA/YmcA/DUF963 family)
MVTLLEYAIERHDVATLDKRHTVEALFYITQMIRSEAHPEKVSHYREIESNLQMRLNELRNGK